MTFSSSGAVFMTIVVAMLVAATSATRIVGVNNQAAEPNGKVFLFGTATTRLRLSLSDGFENLVLRIVNSTETNITRTRCDSTQPLLATIQTWQFIYDVSPSTGVFEWQAVLNLNASSLPISVTTGNSYKLCYNDEESPLRLVVLPTLTGFWDRTAVKQVFAPMPSISSGWERRLTFYFSGNTAATQQLSLNLGSSDVYLVDDRQDCDLRNMIVQLGTYSTRVAFMYSYDVSDSRIAANGIETLRVCVHGSPSDVTVRPLQTVEAANQAITSSTYNQVGVPASTSLTFSLRGLGIGGSTDILGPIVQPAFCETITSLLASWTISSVSNVAAKQITVAPKAAAAGTSVTLCLNITGLSLNLGLEFYSYSVGSVKGVPSSTPAARVQQLFDSASAGTSTIEWPITFGGGSLAPLNLPIFLASDAACITRVSRSSSTISPRFPNTYDLYDTTSAEQEFVAYIDPSWVNTASLPASGTAFLCAETFGVQLRIPGFVVAPLIVDSAVDPANPTQANIAILSGSVTQRQVRVSGSFPAGFATATIRLGCHAFAESPVATVSGNTVTLDIIRSMISEQPSYSGKFCIKFFDVQGNFAAEGLVGDVTVLRPSVIGVNNASAMFSDDTFIPIGMTLPASIALNDIRFDFGCVGAGVGVAAATTAYSDGYRIPAPSGLIVQNYGLCWGVQSGGVVAQWNHLTDIEVVPNLPALSADMVVIASSVGQPIQLSFPSPPVPSSRTALSVAFLDACGDTEETIQSIVLLTEGTNTITIDVPVSQPGTKQICVALVPLETANTFRSGASTTGTTTATSSRRRAGTLSTERIFDSLADAQEAERRQITGSGAPAVSTAPAATTGATATPAATSAVTPAPATGTAGSFLPTSWYSTRYSRRLGQVTALSVSIGSATSGAGSALTFPLTPSYTPPTSASFPVAVTPALPAGASIQVFLANSADERDCFAGPPAGSTVVQVGTGTASIDINLRRVLTTGQQAAAMCARLQTATVMYGPNEGYRYMGISVAGFQIATLDDVDVEFGVAAPTNPIGLSVLFSRNREFEMEGINLQYVKPLGLRLYQVRPTDCATATGEIATLDMTPVPDGSSVRVTIPDSLSLRFDGACVVATSVDGTTQGIPINLFFLPLPFSSFDSSPTDNKQQNFIVGAGGIVTYSRVLKASGTVPIADSSVTFATVKKSTDRCATVNGTGDLRVLKRVVDTEAVATLEVNPPVDTKEDAYPLCAIVSDTSGETILATGISVVVLNIVIAGKSVSDRSAVIAAKVGDAIELHIQSGFIDLARVQLAISDSGCGGQLTGTNGDGTKRPPIAASGCGATGVTVSFTGPTSVPSSTYKNQLCIAMSSAAVPALNSSNLRFAATGVSIKPVDTAASLALKFEREPSTEAPGSGALTVQPVLYVEANGIRLSSLPFALLVTAQWISLTSNTATGENYTATFDAGSGTIDFSRATNPISFTSSLYSHEYVLKISARGTASVASINSTTVVRQPCGTATLLAVPFSQTCSKCPTTASCDGSSRMTVSGSYWRPSNTSLNFYSCAEPYGGASCMSDSETGECLEGHEGPRCSVCSSGYGKSTSGRCRKCNRAADIFVVLLAVLGIVCVLLILIDSTMRCRKSDQFPTWIRIALNHVTVAGVIGNMGRYIPTELRTLFSIQKQVTQPSPEFSHFECATEWSWYGLWTSVNIFPIVMFVIVLLFSAAYKATSPKNEEEAKSQRDKDDDEDEIESERRILSFGHCVAVASVVVMFVAYPTLVSWNLRPGNCDEIDYGGTTGIKRFLAYDRSIDCDSSEHKRYLTASSFLVVIWGVGLPAIIAIVYAAAKSKPGSYVAASRAFTFVVGGYRPNAWWWEATIFARKLLIILIANYVVDVHLQTLLGSWVIAICFILHERIEPFEYETSDIMEKLSLLVLFLTMSMMLLFDFATDDNSESVDKDGLSDGGKAVLGVLLAINIIIMIWMLLQVLPEGVRKLRKQLHRRRNSLRKTLPGFMYNIVMKISLPDIIMINVLDPDGKVIVIPKKEDDLASDWEDDAAAIEEEPPSDSEPTDDGKTPSRKHSMKRKHRRGSKGKDDSVSEDSEGDTDAKKNRKKKQDVNPKAAKAAQALMELPDELDPNAPSDGQPNDDGAADNDDNAKAKKELAQQFKAGKSAADAVASIPPEMEEDPSVPEDEARRRRKMQAAFVQGRSQRHFDGIIEELDGEDGVLIAEEGNAAETARRKAALKAAFAKGRVAADVGAGIPEELDDEADGLSDEERSKRKSQQSIFKIGRAAQRAEDTIDELEEEETNETKKKALRDAFANGRKARESDDAPLPEELRDDAPGLDDEERSHRRKLAMAYRTGRTAAKADALVDELDDPSTPNDETSRKFLAAGRNAAVAQRKKGRSGAAPVSEPELPEELRDDVDGLSDDEVQQRRRLQAIYRQGKKARNAELAMEELEEDPTLDSSDRKKISTSFQRGRAAQQAAELAALPEELRDDVGVTPTGDDTSGQAERRKKKVAFLQGRRAATMATALVEPDEEAFGMESPDSTPGKASASTDKLVTLQKQMNKSQKQVEEQLEAIAALVTKVALLEDENSQLRKDQKDQALQQSMAEEMQAMLESLERLQQENDELRAAKKPGALFAAASTKAKLAQWKQKSKDWSAANKNEVASIIENAEQTEKERQALLNAQKKQSDDQIRAKIEAKRAARKARGADASGSGAGAVPSGNDPANDADMSDAVKNALNDTPDDAQPAAKVDALTDIATTLDEQNREISTKLADALANIQGHEATIAALSAHSAKSAEEMEAAEQRHITELEKLLGELDAAKKNIVDLEAKMLPEASGTAEPAAEASVAPAPVGARTQWGKMGRMLRSDPTNGLYAMCVGARNKKKAGQSREQWEHKMQKLNKQLADGKLDTKNLQAELDALNQLYTLVQGLYDSASSEQMTLSEDLARNKRLVTMLQRRLRRFNERDVTAEGTAAKATEDAAAHEEAKDLQSKAKEALLAEAEQKSAERRELEAAERAAQQDRLQARLEAKRAKRKSKLKSGGDKAPSAEDEKTVVDAITKIVDADLTAQDSISAEVPEPTLESIMHDPVKLREFAIGLRDAVAELNRSNADLAERYAAVVERLSAQEELNSDLVDGGAALAASPSTDMQSQLDALTRERDELRTKLDSLGNSKYSLKRAGDVQQKIKVWKAGAASRNQERTDATSEIIKESEEEAKRIAARQAEERSAQQNQIRSKLEAKRARRRKEKFESLEAQGKSEEAAHVENSFLAGEASILGGDNILEFIHEQEKQELKAAEAGQSVFADPKRSEEMVTNLRGVVEGFEAHNSELTEKYTTASVQLEEAVQEQERLKALAKRTEELAIQSDKSLAAQTDELQILAATIKDLQEQNEAMKAGVLDKSTGATAADLLQEVDYLKRRIAVLESETGMKTGDGTVASQELRGKLAGWTKSAKRNKKKRDDVVSNLIQESETQSKLMAAQQDAGKDAQMSALEKKLAAKRAARESKRPGTSPAGTVIDIGDPNAAKPPEDNPTAVVDSNGEVLLKPRRHAKLGEAKALSMIRGQIKKAAFVKEANGSESD